MSQHLDLKALERRAFRSTFQDGLWDIWLGLVFLMFAVSPLLEEAGVSRTTTMILWIGVDVVAFLILWLGKKYVTIPRLGLVRFGLQRQAKLRRLRLVLAVSGLVVLIATLALNAGEKPGEAVVLGAFAAIIIAVFGLMAYSMDFDRLYVYAVSLALSLPVGEVLREHAGLPDAGYAYFVTAGLIIAIGIIHFTRFLRDYPLPAQEAQNGTP
jgi:hypothetical protein